MVDTEKPSKKYCSLLLSTHTNPHTQYVEGYLFVDNWSSYLQCLGFWGPGLCIWGVLFKQIELAVLGSCFLWDFPHNLFTSWLEIRLVLYTFRKSN